MVALAGIVSDGFLEGQVFFASEEKQIAYRRLDVRPVENRTFRDSQTALQSDRIRRIPTGRQHRGYQVIFIADDGKVEGITVYTGASGRDPWTAHYGPMFGGERLP